MNTLLTAFIANASDRRWTDSDVGDVRRRRRLAVRVVLASVDNAGLATLRRGGNRGGFFDFLRPRVLFLVSAGCL